MEARVYPSGAVPHADAPAAEDDGVARSGGSDVNDDDLFGEAAMAGAEEFTLADDQEGPDDGSGGSVDDEDLFGEDAMAGAEEFTLADAAAGDDAALDADAGAEGPGHGAGAIGGVAFRGLAGAGAEGSALAVDGAHAGAAPAAADLFADEADMFTALVASEHLGEWVEMLGNAAREPEARASAARELTGALLGESGAMYAAEAAHVKAADALARALAGTDDDDLVAAITEATAALTRATHDAESVRRPVTLRFGPPGAASAASVAAAATDAIDGSVAVTVKLGGASDCLGARVWPAAMMLAQSLASDRWFAGSDVLELGSGTGVCGLVAAETGATTVTLTDGEDEAMVVLRESVAAHIEASRGDAGPACSVRRLAWKDWARRAPGVTAVNGGAVADGGEDGVGADAPPLAPREGGWPAVIASDVLYERDAAGELAGCLRIALAAGGRALLVCPIREPAAMDDFCAEAVARGLRVAATEVAAPGDTDATSAGPRQYASWAFPDGSGEVTSGYVRFDVDRIDAPYAAWDVEPTWLALEARE